MYRVEYLPTTRSDFKNIIHFHKNVLKNKPYAKKVTKQIKDKVKSLKKSPKICESFNFISDNPLYPSPILYTYRKLVVGYYIVLYVVDDNLKKIIVVRVIDGRSDYQNNL